MTGNLDQHVCLRDVNGVVPYLGQKDSVDLQYHRHTFCACQLHELVAKSLAAILSMGKVGKVKGQTGPLCLKACNSLLCAAA